MFQNILSSPVNFGWLSNSSQNAISAPKTCEQIQTNIDSIDTFMEKFLSSQIGMYEAPEASSWLNQVRVAGRIIASSKYKTREQLL